MLRIGYIFPRKKVERMRNVLETKSIDVKYVEYSVDQLLSENPPQIDILLHKLSHQMVHATTDPSLAAQLQQLKQHLAQYPNLIVVDPLEAVEQLTDRLDCHRLLETMDASFHLPRMVHKPTGKPTLRPPFIAKSIDSCGKSNWPHDQSHVYLSQPPRGPMKCCCCPNHRPNLKKAHGSSK